jgi:prepilin-type N-terminal cleavage/methylation domain-containing protein
MLYPHGTSRGFTLVELLVAMVIISILSSVVLFSVSGARKASRDAERQSDLRAIQTAVEAYKQKNGRYPAMASSGSGCTYVDNFATESNCYPYIVGLEPFMPKLPRDENRGSGQGYGYITNSAGTAYKIIAMNTVESEVVTDTHPFASCDFSRIDTLPDMVVSGSKTFIAMMCDEVVFAGNSRPTQCELANPRFQKSYAVWGGFAAKTMTATDALLSGGGRIDETQKVICR